MNKTSYLLLILTLLSGCSFDRDSSFWSSTKKIELEKNYKQILKKEVVIGQKLNSTLKVKLDKIKSGVDIIEFVSENKILTSKSEVRRAILNKGLKINGNVINDVKMRLKLEDFKDKTLKLSYGKKKHFLIKII